MKAFICKISSDVECESNVTKSSLWLKTAYLEDETTFAPQSALKCYRFNIVLGVLNVFSVVLQ